MVPVEHCKNFTSWHCCMLSSDPIQFTSMGCDDETAMLVGTPTPAKS